MKAFIISTMIGLASLCSVPSAQAQFLDLRHMVQNNLNYDHNFHQWAWKRSVQLARQIPNNVQLPFNAGTLAEANRQTNLAYGRYNQTQYLNSRRTHQAIGNWTQGAIRGTGTYYNPSTGTTHQLPWTHSGYYQGNYGNYAYPGHLRHGYGRNLYPY